MALTMPSWKDQKKNFRSAHSNCEPSNDPPSRRLLLRLQNKWMTGNDIFLFFFWRFLLILDSNLSDKRRVSVDGRVTRLSMPLGRLDNVCSFLVESEISRHVCAKVTHKSSERSKSEICKFSRMIHVPRPKNFHISFHSASRKPPPRFAYCTNVY